jgi:hypothetical protein
MSSFATYVVGFVVLILGLAMAAFLLNVPPVWIGIGVVILLGIALASAATKTQRPD